MVDNLLKLFKFKPDEIVYTIHRKSMNSKYIPKRVYISYVSAEVTKRCFRSEYDIEINYSVRQVSGDKYSNKHLESEVFKTRNEAKQECNKRNIIAKQEANNNSFKTWDDVWYVDKSNKHIILKACIMYIDFYENVKTIIILTEDQCQYKVSELEIYKTRREAREEVKLQKENERALR